MIKKFLRTQFNNLWMEYKILKSKKKLTYIKKEEKKIFIFLASDYRNMGDVAITYAQKMFLKDTFKNYKIIEIPANETLEYIKTIKNNITRNDIVTTIGGGNMGDIYEYYESLRRLVIKKFRKNFVISFPQTIDFSNTKKGKKSLRKTEKIIKKHKNILILARENKSYEKMQDVFGKSKVMLTPDIVLYLKDRINIIGSEKNKIGICFRNDKEINIKYNKMINNIKNEVKDSNKFEFDTYISEKEFEYERRYDILEKLLKDIAECKVIYTNRLHAMIFSYLVDTKCYFIDNSNNKISQTYKKWLSECSYIIEATNENINNQIYDEILDSTASDKKIKKEFTKLKIYIKKLYDQYVS